jgi:small GTP-binding protein
MDGVFRVIVLGSTEVGKTSLISRYTADWFSLSMRSSDFATYQHKKTVQYKGNTYQLIVFDTGGQERYDSVPSSFYRNIQGVFLIYDITNLDSFKKLQKWYLRFLDFSSDIPVILVGNKTDLEDQRQVSTEVSSSYARQCNFSCLETSARNGEGVEFCFMKMVEIAVLKLQQSMASSQQTFAEDYSRLGGGNSIVHQVNETAGSERRLKKSSKCC